MDPEAVPGLQVGHARDGQRFPRPGNSHLYPGPGQIKGRTVRPEQTRRQQYESQLQKVDSTKHSFIVRGSEGMVGRRKGRKCVADHTKVSTPQVDFECIFRSE